MKNSNKLKIQKNHLWIIDKAANYATANIKYSVDLDFAPFNTNIVKPNMLSFVRIINIILDYIK
jgi:hypothetical protein